MGLFSFQNTRSALPSSAGADAPLLGWSKDALLRGAVGRGALSVFERQADLSPAHRPATDSVGLLPGPLGFRVLSLKMQVTFVTTSLF